MIFESKEERLAFNFVCELADREMDRHGCSDLSPEDMELFGGCEVESYDPVNKVYFSRKIMHDFDVIHWLRKRMK